MGHDHDMIIDHSQQKPDKSIYLKKSESHRYNILDCRRIRMFLFCLNFQCQKIQQMALERAGSGCDRLRDKFQAGRF